MQGMWLTQCPYIEFGPLCLKHSQADLLQHSCIKAAETGEKVCRQQGICVYSQGMKLREDLRLAVCAVHTARILWSVCGLQEDSFPRRTSLKRLLG